MALGDVGPAGVPHAQKRLRVAKELNDRIR
jgi:hypothetical protein